MVRSVQLGKYRLRRRLAAGGMAEIWDAVVTEPPGSHERVAIKRILPKYGPDESIRRMFLDEARIASRLDHQNVVRVLDWGRVDGSDYIAMEFVDGIDAARAVRFARSQPRPMPAGLALHVVGGIARGLDHAHGLVDEAGKPLGIVHRDVSPSNILLGWHGEAKLSDFGIAYAAERYERTATGVVKGKEMFMSPEQALGEAVSPASDVYALGVTLHGLLTGRPPLKDLRAVLARFRGTPLPLDETLDEDVRGLIARAMELEPAARPPAAQVAADAEALARARIGLRGAEMLKEWLDPIRRAGAFYDLIDLSLDLE